MDELREVVGGAQPGCQRSIELHDATGGPLLIYRPTNMMVSAPLPSERGEHKNTRIRYQSQSFHVKESYDQVKGMLDNVCHATE